MRSELQEFLDRPLPVGRPGAACGIAGLAIAAGTVALIPGGGASQHPPVPPASLEAHAVRPGPSPASPLEGGDAVAAERTARRFTKLYMRANAGHLTGKDRRALRRVASPAPARALVFLAGEPSDASVSAERVGAVAITGAGNQAQGAATLSTGAHGLKIRFLLTRSSSGDWRVSRMTPAEATTP